MRSLNEIKALVETYQGFSLLYFAINTSPIIEEVDIYETGICCARAFYWREW